MIPIDDSARKSALDLNHSVIVQAPAGSGKTELLCQRFLTALAQVQQPEQVLAITFTRKAAHEMRERILRYLQNPEHPLSQQVLIQDKKNNWQLLEHSERLSIMTIDSLCAQIVEQAPIASALHGYQTSDAANDLYRTAVSLLLEDVDQNHPWQQALHTLLLQCNNHWEKLQDLLVTMLAKREQWLMLLPEINEPQQWRTRLEANLSDCLQQAIHSLNQKLSVSLKNKLLPLLHFAAKNSSLFIPWQSTISWPEPHIEHENLWRDLTLFLLTKENQLRKTVDKRLGFPVGEGEDKEYFKMQKQNMLDALEEIAATEGLTAALQMMQQVPPAHYSESQWRRVLVILTVLRALLAYWQITLQQKKQVDFSEIALRAVTALGSNQMPTELALKLDYRLQHILVDEFQDTSWLQFHLLEQLTQSWQEADGHTLFLVGDPLQSIYRFRQAEVGLFLRAWQQGLSGLNLKPIQLKQNFRAQKNLVEFYNKQLAQILPKVSVMHEGAVAYVGVASAKPASPQQATSFFNDSNESKQASTADLIQQIQSLQKNNSSATLAILVRSRSHLYQIIPALNQAQINYQARDLSNLNEQPVVVDLLSWLKALLNSEDRLSWLAMLNSPCLRLSLSTLQQLFEKDGRIVWQKLVDLQNNLSEKLPDHVQQIMIAWQNALNQLQRKPLDQILHQLWHSLMAANYWSDALSLQATQQFFSLLQKFQHAGDLADLAQFERYLSEQKFSAKEQSSSLEIMTVHKAKGLEFDIVFLPELDRRPHHDEAPLLLFDEIILPHGIKFLLAPLHEKGAQEDRVFNFLWQIQKKKAEHERLRLLYVACTRAKQAIYFYATSALEKPKQGSFFSDLWPIWPK